MLQTLQFARTKNSRETFEILKGALDGYLKVRLIDAEFNIRGQVSRTGRQ